MKLEKVTAKPGRRYHDACGAAHGLDLIGERWALLVVRELMLGPRRFGDLKKDLHGISANVLTQRLEGLEASGVLRRRKLPPPASVQVYGLTQWGYAADQLLMVLGNWAARSPGHDPTLPLSKTSLMLSFRTMFRPEAANDACMTVGFQLGEETFRVLIMDGTLTPNRGPIDDADVIFTTTPEVMAGYVYGKVPLEVMEATGAITIDGDRDRALAFQTFFDLPPKAPMPA